MYEMYHDGYLPFHINVVKHYYYYSCNNGYDDGGGDDVNEMLIKQWYVIKPFFQEYFNGRENIVI